LPAALRPDAGGATVSGRAGPRLGRPAQRAEGPPQPMSFLIGEHVTVPRSGVYAGSQADASIGGKHVQHQQNTAVPDPTDCVPTGVGGRAPAAAGEGEGADPRPGRAGRGASPDTVASAGKRL